MNITEIYCDVDDFCKVFLPAWQHSLLPKKTPKRRRPFTMSPAEVMTLLIVFQGSNYRDFKHYYTDYVPGVFVSFPSGSATIALLNLHNRF